MIAEVALAFAGLIGIARVFGIQSRLDVFRAQYFLTFAMVGFSLQAALFAFLPFVIAVFLQLAYSGYFFLRLVQSLRPEP